MTEDIVKKRIPIRDWYELDRKNAIIARMVADRPSFTSMEREKEESGSEAAH